LERRKRLSATQVRAVNSILGRAPRGAKARVPREERKKTDKTSCSFDVAAHHAAFATRTPM
jgi:hypothetical protein